MSKIDDFKFFINQVKADPRGSAKLIAQAAVLTTTAMVAGVLIVRGAVAIQEQLKAQK